MIKDLFRRLTNEEKEILLYLRNAQNQFNTTWTYFTHIQQAIFFDKKNTLNALQNLEKKKYVSHYLNWPMEQTTRVIFGDMWRLTSKGKMHNLEGWQSFVLYFTSIAACVSISSLIIQVWQILSKP